MTIQTTFTAEEYTALLAAMERSGFVDVRSFIYWAVMQQTQVLLAEAEE
jgi:hypothetical protein